LIPAPRRSVAGIEFFSAAEGRRQIPKTPGASNKITSNPCLHFVQLKEAQQLRHLRAEKAVA
jgi:hypothetical protein